MRGDAFRGPPSPLPSPPRGERGKMEESGESKNVTPVVDRGVPARGSVGVRRDDDDRGEDRGDAANRRLRAALLGRGRGQALRRDRPLGRGAALRHLARRRDRLERHRPRSRAAERDPDRPLRACRPQGADDPVKYGLSRHQRQRGGAACRGRGVRALRPVGLRRGRRNGRPGVGRRDRLRHA